MVGRIHHTQRIDAAQIALQHAQLACVAPAAGHRDGDLRTVAGLDSELSGKVVDGDAVAGERVLLGLTDADGGEKNEQRGDGAAGELSRATKVGHFERPVSGCWSDSRDRRLV